jgi:hypothetical protein
MSTQVNFEVKLPDTGSIVSEDLEHLMKELRKELQKTAEDYLFGVAVVPPRVLIRGPEITYLKS